MIWQQIVTTGTTPSGVGLVVSDRGDVRLTTPCCNDFFREGGPSKVVPAWEFSTLCVSCDRDYTLLMQETDAVLDHQNCKLENIQDSRSWIARALGFKDRQNDFTITVTWS